MKRIEMNVMNSQLVSGLLKKSILTASVVTAALTAVACWDNHPCDPGKETENGICYTPDPKPVPTTEPTGDAGPSDGGDAGDGAAAPAVKTDTFGKTCKTNDDCKGGTAPVCGGTQFPVCTQTDCKAGEANAGACPSTGGWMCFTANSPTACFNPAFLPK